MKGRTIVTISLPTRMAKRLTREQKARGFSRSELFRFIVRRQLDEIDMARLADEGGAFDFLKNEPDLYSLSDIK